MCWRRSDKAIPERLFRLLTSVSPFNVGGPAPDTPNPRLPPMDSHLRPWIADQSDHASRITAPVGHSLFDERFGPRIKRRKSRSRLFCFPNDSVTGCRPAMATCCCRSAPMLRTRFMPCAMSSTYAGFALSVRWKRGKGLSPIARRAAKAKRNPINLLGFKVDCTANPASHDSALMDQVVGHGGSQTSRLAVAVALSGGASSGSTSSSGDRTPLKEQQTIFGRDKGHRCRRG